MTDAAATTPLGARRALVVSVLLVLALAVQTVSTWVVSLIVPFFAASFLDAADVVPEIAYLALCGVMLALFLTPIFVGARRVAPKLPAGPRPFLPLAAVSASAFVLAGGCDLAIGLLDFPLSGGAGIDVYESSVRAVVPAAWLLCAAAWAGSCLLSESRRRTGRAYRWPVVAAGFVMGGIQVSTWWWLATGLGPGAIRG